MADLLSLDTLAKWTQSDTAEVAADPFAADLITKVSELICFMGGHDGTKVDLNGDPVLEWGLEVTDTTIKAPIDVQMVALQVIKRSYENPGQVIQEGSIGPIGGDRVADAQALFMEFTDSERRTITKYNLDGDPTEMQDAGIIFTMSTTRGSESTMPATEVLYVSDDQQINLESSADPRSWDIPLFNPGDPGGNG